MSVRNLAGSPPVLQSSHSCPPPPCASLPEPRQPRHLPKPTTASVLPKGLGRHPRVAREPKLGRRGCRQAGGWVFVYFWWEACTSTLGSLVLGLWRSRAEFVSGKLLLSDFQVNGRQILTPLSCYSLPSKRSELWNFSFYFLPSWPCLRRQQVPLVGGTSSRHDAGKWRREIFTPRNPVWQAKDVWACERDRRAGGSVQLQLLDETFPETERDHFPGERRQGRSVHIVTRLTGDSSLSCHSSMVTACTASASKANTQGFDQVCSYSASGVQPSLGSSGAGDFADCRISLVSYGDTFVGFLVAVPRPYPGLMRRVSVAVLWSSVQAAARALGRLLYHDPLGEVLGSPAPPLCAPERAGRLLWSVEGAGFEQLLLSYFCMIHTCLGHTWSLFMTGMKH